MLKRLYQFFESILGGPASRPQQCASESPALTEQLNSEPAGQQGKAIPAGTGTAPDSRREDGHYLAGMKALEDRAYAEAAHAFRCAVDLNPLFASAEYGLGLALRGSGAVHPALDSMLRAVELKHDHVPALYHAGELHAQLGQVEEARDCFNLALTFDPLSSAARISLARLAAESEGMDTAISMLREAVDAGIADSAVYCSLAEWLTRSGRIREAAGVYETAIQTFPEDLGPLVNLGMLNLAQLGDAREAEILFRRALEIDPGSIEAQANLGLALQEQGRFDEALRHYADRIATHPEVVEFRWNRGLAHLLLGNFDAGWVDYELRKQRPEGTIHRNYTYPDWDGSPLSGKRILVYGEQGIGDEIMFASCLPEVIAQAFSTVIECDGRLVDLYRRSFRRARVEPRIQSDDCRPVYAEVDVQAAVGSLPRHLRRTAAAFPEHHGYLLADPLRVAHWKERLEAAGSGIKVGISWRGGTRRTRAALRSIALDQWLPLLTAGSVQFVSLQRGESSFKEMEDIQRQHSVRIVGWPDALNLIDETAALMRALDLVITVPSTVGHLAGALGQPAWFLLPYSPEWRYQWQGENMPWYPSVRLFRQRASGDWAGVILDVSHALLASSTFIP